MALQKRMAPNLNLRMEATTRTAIMKTGIPSQVWEICEFFFFFAHACTCTESQVRIKYFGIYVAGML